MLEKTPSMDLHKVAEVLMGRSELKSDMEASALLNEKASTKNSNAIVNKYGKAIYKKIIDRFTIR